MIRYFRALTVILLSVTAISASAQSTATTSSPYSRYGIGLLNSATMLPQNVAMGGIGTATNMINGYVNVNPLNPASYAAINYTAIDVGMYSNLVMLSKTGSANQSNSNFRLSHLAFGIPVTKRSALSFGLVPYSELGYQYRQVLPRGYGTKSPADTNEVDNVYSGEGGLSKAFLGYGFAVGKHLFLGANLGYIFGNMKQYSSTEIPNLIGSFNTRQEYNSAVKGVIYDFGTQYTIDLTDEKHVVFGYSASSSGKLSNQSTFVVSQYQVDASNDNENVAADTVLIQRNPKGTIQIPMVNHFGVSYQYDHRYLVGADYSIGNWSALTINGVSQGLQNTSSINVGGQITPNYNALHSYWALVDYRLGFHSDKTYVNVGGTSITQNAITMGLGMPLARNGNAFYKVNFAAEFGQRGTLANSLVKEKYINLHLSFTLNDKWFQKYKFD